MDLTIARCLLQDGITNGAIYALLALALVLVFTVTRVICVPSGEFVAYGTLTLAGLQLGKPPGTVGLLARHGRRGRTHGDRGARLRRGEPGVCRGGSLRWTVRSGGHCRLAWWLAPPELAFPVQVVLTLALVTALGPLLYRIAYQPLAEASVLVLLIVSVAVHLR